MWSQDCSFTISLFPSQEDRQLLAEAMTLLQERFPDIVLPNAEGYGYPISLCRLPPPAGVPGQRYADTANQYLGLFSAHFDCFPYPSQIRFRLVRPLRKGDCIYLLLAPATESDRNRLTQTQKALQEIYHHRLPVPAISFARLKRPFPEGSRDILWQILQPLDRTLTADLHSLTPELRWYTEEQEEPV